MILRHYKIPLRISTTIHKKVMKSLPYWLLMHLFHSWWFYGSPGILGNWCFNENNSLYDSSALRTRLSSRYGLPFLVLAWILLITLIFKNTFLRLQETIRNYLRGTQVEPLGIARHFQQDKELMEKTGIITYDIRKNPYYSVIFKAIEGWNRYNLAPQNLELQNEVLSKNNENRNDINEYSNIHDAEYETGEIRGSGSSKTQPKSNLSLQFTESPPMHGSKTSTMKIEGKECKIIIFQRLY